MYTPSENRLGIQPIAVANTPLTAAAGFQAPQIGQSPFFGKQHPLGTIIRAYDPVYGEGEFIYLQMASTQVVGSIVTWSGYGTVSGDPASFNESQYQAALVANTANLDQPVAFAMSAFPSGSPATAFGWFQISGNAVAATNGTLAGAGAVYISTTAGQITSAQANGKQILNAQALVANGGGGTTGNQTVVAIDRPFMQGQTV
jgi:hypothetical protein